jgi:y4mF family transcriptional regulator
MAGKNNPNGKIQSTLDIGRLVAEQRKKQGLTQAELAGLGLTGTRFIGDLERGKGTVQCDKVLQVLNLLGLEVIIKAREP